MTNTCTTSRNPIGRVVVEETTATIKYSTNYDIQEFEDNKQKTTNRNT